MKGEYRKNAAVIVTDGNGRVLLCERNDLPGVVQTVQGGVDEGETAEEAARRELEEELGISSDDYEITEMLLSTHAYDWQTLPRVQLEDRFYIGQDQRFFLAKVSEDTTFHLDSHEREFSRVWWGSPEELVEKIKPSKRPGIQAAIDAFKRKSTPR